MSLHVTSQGSTVRSLEDKSNKYVDSDRMLPPPTQESKELSKDDQGKQDLTKFPDHVPAVSHENQECSGGNGSGNNMVLDSSTVSSPSFVDSRKESSATKRSGEDDKNL